MKRVNSEPEQWEGCTVTRTGKSEKSSFGKSRIPKEIRGTCLSASITTEALLFELSKKCCQLVEL